MSIQMAGKTNKTSAQKSVKPRKTKAAEVVAEVPTPVVVAYKGFRHDLTCTGGTQPFQYAIGQTFEHSGAVKVGERGIKPDVWYSLSAAGEFIEVSP